MNTLDHDGIEFRYVIEGDGQPMVVVGSSVQYSRGFAPSTLPKHFRMIYADSRHAVASYHPSNAELATLTLEAFADDLETLRLHLGTDTWIVLGHAAHAQIALAYAGKYPERTARLILSGAAPYSLDELGPIQEQFWEANASPERKALHAANLAAMDKIIDKMPEERRIPEVYIANAARFWFDPNFDASFIWDGVDIGRAYGRLYELLPSRAKIRPILEGLQVPTLLIHGNLDFAVPHTVWEEIIAGIPLIDYELLTEVGHNPMIESPKTFDETVIDWLAVSK